MQLWMIGYITKRRLGAEKFSLLNGVIYSRRSVPNVLHLIVIMKSCLKNPQWDSHSPSLWKRSKPWNKAIVKVSNSMRLPIALRRIITDTFNYHICRSLLRPPVIFTKCCRYLLGCQTCVDTWYGGEKGRTKQCPRCWADRGFAETCQVYGLDEFLASMAPLLVDDERMNQ